MLKRVNHLLNYPDQALSTECCLELEHIVMKYSELRSCCAVVQLDKWKDQIRRDHVIYFSLSSLILGARISRESAAKLISINYYLFTIPMHPRSLFHNLPLPCRLCPSMPGPCLIGQPSTGQEILCFTGATYSLEPSNHTTP